MSFNSFEEIKIVDFWISTWLIPFDLHGEEDPLFRITPYILCLEYDQSKCVDFFIKNV